MLTPGNAWAETNHDQTTRDSLLTALKGEAFAYVKYTLFAEKAAQEGYPEVAGRFRAAAHKERFEHFMELAKEYGLVGSTAANLADAIDGERSEATKIYPGFAKQARSEGREKAAALFDELAGDEAKHEAEFIHELTRIESK